ncbi:MAG: DUF692 domain-containing protein [Bacteriovoracaceae bacterium]|nr:DUF692 domain-containing protein [Bacteriovoracaceae bacterium]
MKELTGLGYRAPFHADLINGHPEIGWLEIITENYLWDKGSRRKRLERLRENYELAFHGVSLSLAAPEEFDNKYLSELKVFCDELKPTRVSDHLCWSSTGGHFWHDLLPFPYTEENLNRLVSKVLIWQDKLKRPLVIENLSAYIASSKSEMSEYAFLAALVAKTDCQILLDLNNMVVNSKNFKIDPYKELEHINLNSVAQIHLAGHIDSEHFAIDTHSKAPNEATWDLWQFVSQKKKIPFMIEWDEEIPSFSEVKRSLDQARSLMGYHL